MNTPDKRTIDEVLYRYKKEPTLKDVFVEGLRDKRLLDWFFCQANLSDASAIVIECIDIPPDSVSSHGFLANARGRVLTLACRFRASLNSQAHKAVCLVDQDFDTVIGRLRGDHWLLLTDFTCVEMYLFNETTLRKFFLFQLGLSPSDVKPAMNEFASVLQELFLIRLAKEDLALEIRMLPIKKYCGLSGTIIVFDKEQYLQNMLTAQGVSQWRERLVGQIEQRRPELPGDIRLCAHGHDFLDILSWYSHRRGSNFHALSDHLSVVLYCSLDLQTLLSETLFSNLQSRFQ